MGRQSYASAVQGENGVLIKNDCTQLLDVVGLNNVWSAVIPRGDDNVNIGDHHSSAGFTPDTGIYDPITPWTPIEAAYEFNGLDSSIATQIDANGFQLSVKIDARYIVAPGTTTNEEDGGGSLFESAGYEPLGGETACIFSNSSNGAQIMAKQGSNDRYRNTMNSVVGNAYFDAIELDFDNNLGTTAYAINGSNKTTPPNSENRRVTLTFDCNVVTPGSLWRYYSTFDGNPLETFTSDIPPSDLLDLNNFFFGDRNNGTNNTFPPFVINELLLVDKGPVLVADPIFERFTVDGDSEAMEINNGGSYAHNNAQSSQDLAWWRVFAGRLAAEGIYTQTYNNFGVGGEKMAEILARISFTLDTNPTTFVFQGLTNDAIAKTFDQTTKDAFLDYVEQMFFGAAKDSRTALQRFLINIIPPNFDATIDSGKATAWADVWDFQFAFPAMWDALYPDESGKVIIGGNHAALVSFDHSTWIDTADLSRDGTHWDPLSSFQQGDTAADNYFASFVTGSPTLTTPYPDLINLDTDVVSVNLRDNISGETSIVVTWEPAIPKGLSETNGLVTGTVTTPTSTALATVTGINSFGSVTDSFQWTTLTTGAPTSGINVPINS